MMSRIVQAVESFGGKAVMTRADHESGSDRVAEVAASLDVDAIINLQGDEPLIEPASLELLADLLRNDPMAQIATLAMPIANDETFRNPNCVKVVCDESGRALYFSRSPIPVCSRCSAGFCPPAVDVPPSSWALCVSPGCAARSFLARAPHPLEQLEKLEQLRALGHGWTIRVGIVAHAGRGVDTPADYAQFVADYRAIAGKNSA